MNSNPYVAIDGPAGAGKSTVAKMVAKKLGYIYIDTGAMYRAVTLMALRRGLDLKDQICLSQLAENISIVLSPDGKSGLKVLLNGEDVSEDIRSQNVTSNVSLVAMVPGVRRRLVVLQRAMAEKGGVVMEGRDIGTVVLPDAPVKIFLTASYQERARRRREELAAKGNFIDQEQMEKEILTRDQIDSTREIDPLTAAADARIIDSTSFSVDEVVDMIMALVLLQYKQP
jgi:cytidylate kinase